MPRWSGGFSSSCRSGSANRGALVDLYCGVGTFALFFAKRGWNVIGVEENAQAVAEAVANARLNGLESRAAFVAGRVERGARGRGRYGRR